MNVLPKGVALSLALLLGCQGEVNADLASRNERQDPRAQDMSMGERPVPGPPVIDPFMDPPTPQEDPDPAGVRAPMRRLTPAQYARAVRSLFDDQIEPGVFNDANPDLSLSGYSTESRANPPTMRAAEQLLVAAQEAGAQALERMDTLLPCAANDLTSACVSEFLDTYAMGAFRRPLTVEEREIFERAHVEAVSQGFNGPETMALLITILLQTPQFLYITEAGIGAPDAYGRLRLSPHEVATRVSMMYADTIPDDELLAAANAGELEEAGAIERHARRLLLSEASAPMIRRFVREWLHLEPVLEKNAEAFPWFGPQADQAIREELERAMIQAVQTNATLDAVLRMERVWINATLADMYGVEDFQASANGWAEVTLPERHRGLLARPYFLASHAGTAKSSQVERGYTIMKQLLCSPPGSPPDDARELEPDYPAGITARERSEILQASSQTCAGCHAQIDNIGLALENFDAAGLWRDRTPEIESSRPVDASGLIADVGQLARTDLAGQRFDGAQELTGLLATSQTVEQCIARHWFRFALHESETTEGDAMLLRQMHAAFLKGDSTLQALMLSPVRSEMFLYRQMETP